MNTIKVFPVSEPDEVRPLWSVVIPTYNCLPFLTETIQSVLKQDRGVEKMEIWVVDDCSSENPQRLVEELGGGRIKFFRQDLNVGQLNNFDTCLNITKGKIIHLLHGDDFVHDGFYESLEHALLRDNRLGAAFTGHFYIDESSQIIYPAQTIASEPGVIKDFISVIAGKQVIQTPSIVVKREVYEKLGGFNKDLTWVEDWEMWVRVAANYDFYYDPRTLASYRVHSNSNTADSIKTGRFIHDVINAIGVFSSYLNIPKKRQVINSAKQHYLDYAIKQGFHNMSWTVLWKCFLLVYDIFSFFQVLRAFLVLLKKTFEKYILKK